VLEPASSPANQTTVSPPSGHGLEPTIFWGSDALPGARSSGHCADALILMSGWCASHKGRRRQREDPERATEQLDSISLRRAMKLATEKVYALTTGPSMSGTLLGGCETAAAAPC